MSSPQRVAGLGGAAGAVPCRATGAVSCRACCSPKCCRADICPLPPPSHRRNNACSENNGYCGESVLQMLMLRYGVWIPQEVARAQGGGELLLGVNYDKAMRGLKISYNEWGGRGYKVGVVVEGGPFSSTACCCPPRRTPAPHSRSPTCCRLPLPECRPSSSGPRPRS